MKTHLTVLSMSLAAIWQPAIAQSSDSKSEVETVVVTAQKRSQSIKEVPVAMTVVSAAQLERAGVKDISDLAKTAAALESAIRSRTQVRAAPRRYAASAPP
jgi:iron complex outermembrane receptor protein